MKKLTYIQLLMASLLIVSCSDDVLDTHPYDLKVIGNFYKTPSDAEEALVSAYSVLDWGYYDQIVVIAEVASDDCYGGVGAADDTRYQVWDDFEYNNFFNPHDLLWQRYWYGIFRTNVLLQNIDNVNWVGQENAKAKIVAQTKFLRAYYYYNLVRFFGHIPLLDKPLDPEKLFVAPADPTDVYKLIASDLTYAINNLPAAPYSKAAAAEEGGRATKWAAEALLARVFLFYTGYFNKTEIENTLTKSDVITYVDDVINNSGHQLVDNYNRLWMHSLDKYVGEDNAESVFAIKYTYQGYKDAFMQNGGQWQIMVGVRNQKNPANHYPLAEGWGAGSVDPRLWNAYEPGDMRKNGTIVCWDSMNLKIPLVTDDMREFTGLNWKKFCPLEDSLGRRLVENLGGHYISDNYEDYPDIRFADVLLMGAELNMGSDDAKAQGYYDKVRDRAFGNTNHHKKLTKDLLFEERRLELALEGHRYWDLLRYDGLAGNFAYAKKAIDTEKPYHQAFNTETKGLFSIPRNQIELSNGTLKQNAGW